MNVNAVASSLCAMYSVIDVTDDDNYKNLESFL